MEGFILLFVMLMLILGYLAYESITHNRRLKQIPIRIHVNGTRGKSSVARLIAAGVRAGGYRTVAKTTGTLARMIDVEGKESPIYRVGFTNIAEQINVFKWAHKQQAEAIIIECMALQPLLQSICELKIVKATHGVLTNARPDHLDVMGPSERDVVKALAATVPVGQKFFTAEDVHLDFYEYACKDRGAKLIPATAEDAEKISDEEINNFSYSEFKINVALALKVTDSLGIDRQAALKGMWEAVPDPGAMTEYQFDFQGKEVNLANAFAANDPVSTKMLWDKLVSKYEYCQGKILVVNCRDDREDRSKQMAEAVLGWHKPDLVVLIGTGTSVFEHYLPRYAEKMGIKTLPKCIECEGYTPEQIIAETLATHVAEHYIFVGVGNIKDIGMALVEYCNDRHVEEIEKRLKNKE